MTPPATQSAAQNVSAEQFRAQFPALEHTAYFASCSQGALSGTLASALTEFQASLLDGSDPWPGWLERVEQARGAFAALIGARMDEIAIVSCASEGAYQVSSGFAWGPGQSIVTTELEFPSIAHVWLAQRPAGGRVRYADLVDGFATVESYEQVIDDATRLVSIPLISYRNGQRLPVAQIATLARQRGAHVFIDAYQGVGVEPIDVTALDCDYLVSGALKYLLGIPGLAFLYVRTGTPRDLDPSLTGWFARADPFSFNPRELDFAATARHYQTGTPPVAAAYGALAGLQLLSSVEPATIAAHVSALTDYLHTELSRRGERIASPAVAESRGPQVALRDPEPERLAAYLADQRIITSPRADLLRLAVHYYTNTADVDTVVQAIYDFRTQRW